MLVFTQTHAPANAQTTVLTAVHCIDPADRANGVKFAPARKSLADFSITIAENHKNDVFPSDIKFLDGPCAVDVNAFRMTQVSFSDGAVFSAGFDGEFVLSPGQNGLTKSPRGLVSIGHPSIERADFIMSTQVDDTNAGEEKRSLEVGVWKTSEFHLVSVFIRYGSGFSTPVELVRSTHPVKSVTFFPSPDSNSGKLGLLVDDGNRIALVSLNWDHVALSTLLRSEK